MGFDTRTVMGKNKKSFLGLKMRFKGFKGAANGGFGVGAVLKKWDWIPKLLLWLQKGSTGVS